MKRLLLLLAPLALLAACASSPAPSAETTTTPTRMLRRLTHRKPTTTTTTGSTTTAPSTPTSSTTPVSPGSGCKAGYLPDPRCTPGALNPAVTQATLPTTACKTGWTATIRPPVTESSRLKYGITDSLSNYEGDHLVSLELGGAADSAANLWDEPHVATGPDGKDAGSFIKDRYENYLRHSMCKGTITLTQAQAAITSDWYASYTTAGRP
jgi:hypothetical protein